MGDLQIIHSHHYLAGTELGFTMQFCVNALIAVDWHGMSERNEDPPVDEPVSLRA